MSEREYANLHAQILDFEKRWKVSKLKNKALIKKGVFNYTDSEEYEDLRVERCVFYKPAKKILRHLGAVGHYKIMVVEILNLIPDKPVPVGQLERDLEIPLNIRKPEMGRFILALKELESESKVTITREQGTATQVAKDAILNERREIRLTIPTGSTPEHGYSNCVCGTCMVTLK